MKNKIFKKCFIIILMILMLSTGIIVTLAAGQNESTVANEISDANKKQAKVSDLEAYTARNIATYNNVYCVLASRAMDGALYHYNAGFKPTAMVEIEGDKATFYTISNGKETQNGNSITNTANNILAGILTEKNPNSIKFQNGETFKPSVTIYKGYGALKNKTNITVNYQRYDIFYTVTQVAVHQYYNTWYNAVSAKSKGFEGDNTSNVKFDNIDVAQNYVQAITRRVNEGAQYNAKIYFLQKYGDTETFAIQNLILVEPGEPKDEKINISVKKVWTGEGEDPWKKNRPSGVKITLSPQVNGKTKSITLTPDGWTGEFKDLPKYDANGNIINYTVTEDPIPGYTQTSINKTSTGFEITNSLDKKDITITKKWLNDTGYINYYRSDVSVIVRGTIPNGTDNDTVNRTATLYKDDNKGKDEWTITVKNCPKYCRGKELTYEIQELRVGGYATSIQVNNTNDKFTITNTFQKVNVSVEKEWAGEGEDQWKKNRPSSVTVVLSPKINDEKTNRKITLNLSNNWAGSFSDLPKYDKNGNEINYSVSENAIPGYTASVTETQKNKFKITNTLDKRDIKIKKVWANDEEAYRKNIKVIVRGTIPNGTDDDTVTRDAYLKLEGNEGKDEWTTTVMNCPIYCRGKELTYEVIEITQIPGYTTEITGNQANGFTITNTLKRIEISVEKEWKGEGDYTRNRPADGIIVRLWTTIDGKKSSTNNTITLNQSNGWKGSFNGLAEYTADGKIITYSVTEETQLPGYKEPVYSGNQTDVKITNELIKQNITVKKEWKDDEEAYRKDVKIVLNGYIPSQSGVVVDREITLKKSDYGKNTIWTHEFKNLPTHCKQEKITYKVHEQISIPGYITTYNQDTYTITNTFQPQEVTVTKKWNDGNNTGKRPSSITITLYGKTNNGKNTVSTTTETLTANKNWTHTFTNLPPITPDGTVITYTVDETNISGYQKNINGYTITNTELTNIQVTKNWTGDETNENYRTAVNVNLVVGNQVIRTAELNSAGSWKYIFTDLPKYDENGKLIDYKITEPNVPKGYVAEITENTTNDFVVNNKFQSTDVSVKKVWLDGNGANRPKSITITLYGKVNNVIDNSLTKTVTLPYNNSWSYTFTKLPQVTKDGKTITYSVDENAITNYRKDITNNSNNYIITNTKLIDIPVTKVWDDEKEKSNRKDIVVILYANGKSTDHTINLNGNNTSNTWQGTFTDMPEFDTDNNKINYTIQEKSVPAGYKTPPKVEGFTITNTLSTKDITATKKWEDENNRYNNRPDSVRITLYGKVDNAIVDKLTQEVTLSNTNNWKYTFSELPTHYNGKEITYTIDETQVPLGYIKKSVDNKNYIITNELERIEVPVTKKWEESVWENETEKSNRRPVTIKLYEDGIATNNTIQINGNNNTNTWTGTFTNLPKYKNKKIVNYTINEEPEPIGYNKTSVDNQKYEVTNTIKTIDIPVTKAWRDDTDYDGQRPEQVIIRLYENGNRTDRIITLKANQGWTGQFTNAPEYKDCQKVNYTVKEEISERDYPGYTYEPVTLGNMEDGYTITNIHELQRDGYVKIKGTVWHDKITKLKENASDGILDGEDGIDERMAGIELILKDAQGSPMSCTYRYTDAQGKVVTRTDKGFTSPDGTYEILVNRDLSQNVYKLFENASSVENALKTAYVEFTYDANKYTTVRTADSGKDTSKAKENEIARNTDKLSFDNRYAQVTPTTDVNAIRGEKITARTQGVISFATYARKDIKEEVALRYCNGNGLNGTHIRTDYTGAWKPILTLSNDNIIHSKECLGKPHQLLESQKIDVQVIENVNLGLIDREQPDVAIYSELNSVDVTIRNQMYKYNYNVKRGISDVKAKEKYDEVFEEVKRQKINEGYSESDAMQYAEQYAKQEKLNAIFQEKGTYIYRRPVNPADIAYMKDQENNQQMNPDDRDVKIEVTYKISLANSSTTLPVTINSIANYYDLGYDLSKLSKDSGWIINNGQSGGFKVAQYDRDIQLQPGEEKTIEIKYEVHPETIKQLASGDATLNNAVEIQSYTINYGTKTVYAEQQTGGRTGSYGGYDKDSHPGNAGIHINNGILAANKVEDDTDFAPSFVLCIEEDTNKQCNDYKVLSGNVWEDSSVQTPEKLRLGDGKKTNTEKNVQNVKVELLKYEKNKEINDLETAQLYSINRANGNITKKAAITYTNEEGNYSFDGDENDVNYGVVTDKYVIRFTYGNGTIIKDRNGNDINVNARNYKSTIISKEDPNIYELFDGFDSDEWHLNINGGYSTAVDDIKTRVQDIPDLKYDNFDAPINMIAYTKPFEMQVEFNSGEKTDTVGADGKTSWGNELNIFDFGIVERAREDIFVETTVSNFKIVLANGQALTGGDPRTDKLNYVKTMGFNKEITNGREAKDALEKQLIAEIDTELMQGAQLEITYYLKITNNSEIDYDYYLGDENAEYDPTKERTEFYYLGDIPEDGSTIKESVNYAVVYLDNKLTYTWQHAEEWKAKTADELFVGGFISEKAKEAINNNGYTAYVKEVKDLEPKNLESEGGWIEEVITTQKLLANQDETTYDLHAELLQIDSKVARTQKEPNQERYYKIGNYVPGLEPRSIYKDNSGEEVYVPVGKEAPGLHEQDDDRIKIVITPPTGTTKYIITYVTTGLIGLITIGAIVIFIKKKVLTK